MLNFFKSVSLISALISISFFSKAQQQNWAEMMLDPNSNFYDVQNAFNQYYNNYVMTHGKKTQVENGIRKTKERENEFEVPGFEQFKRWENFMKPRVNRDGSRFDPSIAYNEYQTKVAPLINQTRSTNNWTLLGPISTIPQDGGAGRINFIRFDPANSNHIWAGAPAGGLWESTDGGNTWSTQTDALAVIGCSDLAIDPSNSNIMYLATGDRDAGDTYSIGVLKSIDGGTSWNTTGLTYPVSSYFKVYRLLINPTNSSIVIAATNDGIYRTTNGGSSWTHVVNSGTFQDAELKPGDPNTVYACTAGNVYKSSNSGQTFNIVSGFTISGSVRSAIAVTAADPSIVYLVSANTSDYGLNGFYKSTNSATSFTLMNSTYDVLAFSTSGNANGGQGWYDLCIDASPTNANTVIVGGINAFRSTNGGTSWSIFAAGYGMNAKIHPDVHEIVFLPGSNSTAFVGCDGGIFETTNTGSTWSDLSDGLQIGQAYRLSCSATNANIVTSGWQDNGTNRYNAGAWDEILGGDGMETIISWSSSQTVYGELYYGEIYKSTNGGNTFGNNPICGSGGTNEDEDGEWVTPYVQSPTSASTLYVGKSKIYKTTNSGSNFTALGALAGGSTGVVAIGLTAADANYIYCAKQDKFYVSTNGGTSFTDRTNGLPVSSASITYIAVSNTDKNKVWVTFSGYSNNNKVFFSNNAGQNWSNVSGGLPNVPANCIVYTNNSSVNSLYCGTDIAVYYRDDNTGNWIPYTTGLPNVVVDELDIQYSSSKIRAATFGRGIWEADLYSASISAPTAGFTSDVVSGCAPLSVDFTSTSVFANTYTWYFSGGSPSTSTTQNPTVVYNTAGTYPVKLVVSNVIGADSLTISSYITVGPGMSVNVSGTNSNCFAQNNGSATADITGGTSPFIYIWSNGATTQTLTNLASGGYTVTVTDGLGCVSTDNITLTQPSALLGSINSTPDNGSGNGTLTCNPSGGTPPYTYLWSVGETTQTLNGLVAGNYAVTITDSHGCIKVITGTVALENASPAIQEINSWLIYPNPTHDWLMLDAQKNLYAEISLYNLLGQQIEKILLDNSSSTLVNMSELPTGEYWLKITTQFGVAWKKVMKQ